MYCDPPLFEATHSMQGQLWKSLVGHHHYQFVLEALLKNEINLLTKLYVVVLTKFEPNYIIHCIQLSILLL